MKIAIIGSGNMGGAIARGLVAGGVCVAGEIVCTARSAESLERISVAVPGVKISSDNARAVAGADFVVLAVKPWLVEEISAQIRESVSDSAAVISVAAGISFERLDAFFARRLAMFRAIPNTAAMLGKSMTFLAAHNASEARVREVVAMFSALGETLVVEESQMAAGTALASCGIAFAMRYAEAAIAGGRALGFDAETAEKIVLRTIAGAVAVLENSSEGVAAEIRRVTTPGGLTERGLKAMTEHDFERAVVAGLEAAK